MVACLQKCPLCQRACPGGHFHAIERPAEPHLCGREHACADPVTGQASMCGCAGFCDISARLQKERKENAVVRVYQGKRDKFEYEYKTRQDVKRNVCTQKVPPGQLRHAGPCCCEIKPEDHFCAHECPGCLYRYANAAEAQTACFRRALRGYLGKKTLHLVMTVARAVAMCIPELVVNCGNVYSRQCVYQNPRSVLHIFLSNAVQVHQAAPAWRPACDAARQHGEQQVPCQSRLRAWRAQVSPRCLSQCMAGCLVIGEICHCKPVIQ